MTKRKTYPGFCQYEGCGVPCALKWCKEHSYKAQRGRRFSGTCEWDGCSNPCPKRWCEEHRQAGYKLLHKQAHQRRMQDPVKAAKARAQSRDYQRRVRSTWGPLDKHLEYQKQRLSKYGVTLDWYNAQIERQGGRCAICQEVPTGERPWHVDHCHDSGIVRELLCGPCNTGLGHMRDNPAVLRAAADYLERHRQGLAA